MMANAFPRTRSHVTAGLPAIVQRNAAAGLRGPLNDQEKAHLQLFEGEIERRLEDVTAHFREIGAVLANIRDQRLYRAEYATFEEYCHKRWHRSGRRIRQLCDASDVVRNLEAATASELGTGRSDRSDGSDGSDGSERASSLPLPRTENQARALAAVPREEQAEVWTEAVQSAPAPEKVTARHVREVISAKRGWPRPNANGVYDEKAAERIGFKNSKLQAEIHVLQIGLNEWVQSHGYRFPGSSVGCCGQSSPLKRGKIVLTSRELAVMNAAGCLEDDFRSKLNDHCAAAIKAAAHAGLAWAERVNEEATERTRSRCSNFGGVEEVGSDLPAPAGLRTDAQRLYDKRVASADYARLTLAELQAACRGEKILISACHSAMRSVQYILHFLSEHRVGNGKMQMENGKRRVSAAGRARLAAAAKARWVAAKAHAR